MVRNEGQLLANVLNEEICVTLPISFIFEIFQILLAIKNQ